MLSKTYRISHTLTSAAGSQLVHHTLHIVHMMNAGKYIELKLYNRNSAAANEKERKSRRDEER